MKAQTMATVPPEVAGPPIEDVVSLSLPRKEIMATLVIEQDVASLPKRRPYVAAETVWEDDEA